MVAKKSPVKKTKKLSVKKETLKDLDTKPGKAGGVKGGADGTSACETRFCKTNRPSCGACVVS